MVKSLSILLLLTPRPLFTSGFMFALHVVLEADVVVEALPTVLALEGFLPRVDAHVGLEVP